MDTAKDAVVDAGRHCHPECVPWHERSFPLTAELWEMRRRYRQIKAAYDALTVAGTWLSALARRWPQGAAAAMREWPKLRARVEFALARAAGDRQREHDPRH